MKLTVKYWTKTGRYYVQDRDRSYDKINHKMKRVQRNIGMLRRQEQQEQRARLREVYQELMKQRQQAEAYVEIAKSDIPAGVKIKEVRSLVGYIQAIPPAQYQALLLRLKRKGEQALKWEQSCSMPEQPQGGNSDAR